MDTYASTRASFHRYMLLITGHHDWGYYAWSDVHIALSQYVYLEI